ncbi:hypothetical protein DPEC_G00179290 [Dallia pectoralis]|uniref:Uncharacterized protein n=1 Tax=Dallia pectoralis TaxID=75939 RepID=A0ACC2GFW7_DALPE|nr:hypothetical protein DPEC_G00179290 [Dallia pectoralis]
MITGLGQGDGLGPPDRSMPGIEKGQASQTCAPRRSHFLSTNMKKLPGTPERERVSALVFSLERWRCCIGKIQGVRSRLSGRFRASSFSFYGRR